MVTAEIEELQTRIAFQEDLIQKLDDALGTQQREIMDLKQQLTLLVSQIRQIEQNIPDAADDEPPPHY